MFGFGAKRKRITQEVIGGLSPYIRIYEMTTGKVPKGFWEDDYVLGYLGTVAFMLTLIANGKTPAATDLGFIMTDTFQTLSEQNGMAIVNRINLLSSPDFQAGKKAGEKVVSIAFGSRDYDNDPDVSVIRERLGRGEWITPFENPLAPDHVTIAGSLMTSLFHSVVEKRLGR